MAKCSKRLSLVSIVGSISLALVISGWVRNSIAQSHEEPSESNRPSFDVVSIRQSQVGGRALLQFALADGFRAKQLPLLTEIVIAYLPREQWISTWAFGQVLGGPSWVRTQPYDFDAKVADSELSAWQKQGSDKVLLQLMLRAALSERCGLVLHRISVEMDGYSLEVAKHGPNWKELRVATHNKPLPDWALPLVGGGQIVPFARKDLKDGESPRLTFLNTSMKSLAAELSESLGSPIEDRTGLTGVYDFALIRQNGDDIPRATSEGSKFHQILRE